MSRILICLDNKRNQALLLKRLAHEHEICESGETPSLELPFDLGILDGPSLTRLRPWAIDRRRAAEPVFLPFLLVTAHDPADLPGMSLWEVVDSLLITPVTTLRLQAQVEVLLRARRLSLAMDERYHDLEAFGYSVSHDLRAPLRTIRMMAEALASRSSSALDAEARRNLARILQAADRADRMVQDLLTYDRITQLEVRPATIALDDAIQEALKRINGLISASGAEVSTVEPLRPILGQEALVTQIVQNLITNAVTYVAPGVQPQVRLWTETRGETVRLWVQDNGIGIAPEFQERIFGLFQRLHPPDVYPGTGIGLAAVRRAAERLNGHVGVESVPGRGSRFWVEFCTPNDGGGH